MQQATCKNLPDSPLSPNAYSNSTLNRIKTLGSCCAMQLLTTLIWASNGRIAAVSDPVSLGRHSDAIKSGTPSQSHVDQYRSILTCKSPRFSFVLVSERAHEDCLVKDPMKNLVRENRRQASVRRRLLTVQSRIL